MSEEVLGMGQGGEVDGGLFDPKVDDEMDRVFAALANARRRRIYALLCQRAQYPMELQQKLGEVSAAAITRHLRVLAWARLIYAHADHGLHRRYQGDREQLLHVRKWVEEIERLPFEWVDAEYSTPEAKRRRRRVARARDPESAACPARSAGAPDRGGDVPS